MNFPTPIVIVPTNPQFVGSKSVPKGRKLSYSGFMLKYLLSTGKEMKDFNKYAETKALVKKKKIINNELNISKKLSSIQDPSIEEIRQAINPKSFDYQAYAEAILGNIPEKSFISFEQAGVFTQTKSSNLSLTTIEVALYRFLIMNIFNILANDHSQDGGFLILIQFLFKFQLNLIEEAIYLLSVVFNKFTDVLSSNEIDELNDRLITQFASLCVEMLLSNENHFISNEMHGFLLTYLMKQIIKFDVSQKTKLLMIALTKTSLPILQTNQDFFVNPIIDSICFLLTAVIESLTSDKPSSIILNKRNEIMAFVFSNELINFQTLLIENFQMKDKTLKSIPDLTIQCVNLEVESSSVFKLMQDKSFSNFSTEESKYFNKPENEIEQMDDEIIECDHPITLEMMIDQLDRDSFIFMALHNDLPFNIDDLNISNFIQTIHMNQSSSYIHKILKQFAANILNEMKTYHNMKSASKFILLMDILKSLQAPHLINFLQLINTNMDFIGELGETFIFTEKYLYFSTPLTNKSLTYLFMNVHNNQYPLDKLISIQPEIPADLELYEKARKLFVSFICYIFQIVPNDILNMIKKQLSKKTIPEVSNWFIGLLRVLFNITPDLTTTAMDNTDFFNILAPYLKRIHNYYRYYRKQSGMNKIAELVNKFRLNAMMFTIQMFQQENSKKLMLSSLRIIDFLFDILYEEEFIHIVLQFIKQGLRYSDPIRLLTLIIKTIFHCTTSYRTTPTFLKLLNQLLYAIGPSFRQKQITNNLIETNLYSIICQIPKHLLPIAAENAKIKVDIANNVLLAICGMSGNNLIMKKKLIKAFKDNELASTLSKMSLNEQTIDILLKLIFESEIKINECESVEIKFNKALPFVHVMLLNKPEYITVFKFIEKITKNSFSNKIHIYRTNLFSLFLEEMRKYPMEEDLSKQKKEEFEIMLEIIQSVSRNFFRPQMLIEILKAFRVNEKKKNRTWIISRFIKIFGNILNDQSKQIDSFVTTSNSLAISPSFFHFNGYNSKLTVLDQNKFADIKNGNGQGFSFVCRFQLDKEYLKKDKPRLLSFILSTNVGFDFFFDNDYLYYEITDIIKQTEKTAKNEINYKVEKTEKIDYKFSVDKWYTLIIKGNSNDKLEIYINSPEKVASFSIHNSVFDKFINFTVCNSVSHTDREDFELICNVASIYLFKQSISRERIKDIMSLPIEFPYSFKQSNQNIFPNLPSALFTDDKVEKSLLFVFNANKFSENQPVNLIGSENISAEFVGCRLPYNSSFITSIINFSGMEVFLPLIDQVDMPTKSNEENQKFLLSLLELFILLNNSSDKIELHFTRSNGYKSLAHIFSKLSNYLLTTDVFNALKNFYFSLRYTISKSSMILDFLLNYNAWSKLTVQQQNELNSICLLPTIIREFENEIKLNTYKNIYRHYVPFSYLLAIIVEINNFEIQYCYLQLVLTLIKYTFEKANQDYFINLTFKLTGNVQSQFLLVLNEIIEKDYGDFHLQLANPLFYHNLVALSSSQNEVTRITAIKILITGRKYLSKDPIQFDTAILSFIKNLNVSSISDDEWNSIEKLTMKPSNSNGFQLTNAISILLPLLAYYSHFANPRLVDSFIHKLNLIAIENNDASLNLLISSPNYMENLFYIYLNSKKPVVTFSEFHEMMNIFNVLFVYLISSNNYQAYRDALTQLYLIECVTQLDVSSFLSQVFTLILRRKELEKPSIFSVILPDIFTFLFYIPSYSHFSINSDLYSLYSTNFHCEISNQPLSQKFDHNELDLKWPDYVSLFQPSKSKNDLSLITYSFKFKLDNKNKWPDQKLADSLIELFNKILFTNSIKTISNANKITYFDFYSMVEIIKLKSGQKFNFSKVIPDLLLKITKNNPDVKQTIQIICALISSMLNDENNLKTVLLSISEILPKEIESFINLNKDIENQSNLLAKKEFQNRFMINFYQNVLDGFFLKISEDCLEYAKKAREAFACSASNMVKSLQVEGMSVVIDTNFINNYITHIPPLLTSNKNICLSAYNKLLQDQNFDTVETNDVHWMFSPQLDKIGRHIFQKKNRHFDPSIYKVKTIQNDSMTSPHKDKDSPKKRVHNNAIGQSESTENNDDDDDDEYDTFEEEEEDIIVPKKLPRVDSITTPKEETDSKKKKMTLRTNTVLITISKQYYGSLIINLDSIQFSGTELIKPMEYTDRPNRLRNKQQVNPPTKEFLKTKPDGDVKTVEIPLSTIQMILLRSYLHVKEGFEVFLTNRKSYFFFLTEFNRKKVIQFFRKIQNNYLPKCSIFQTSHNQNLIQETKLKDLWIRGEISTYYYLIYINLFAGRTFNDSTQYPIFPWVLKEFDNNEIDLTDASIYRDFSKPINVIGENKVELATMNYNERAHEEFKEPFHHNIFYSKDFILCLLMIRVEPFTTLYLRTQKYFDLARYPSDIKSLYMSTLANFGAELIPELFTTPEILTKKDKTLNFGNDNFNNMGLPNWVLNKSAHDFIKKHRLALESDYVSHNINQWIDLVFGFKQTGPEAVKALNTYDPYLYPGYLSRHEQDIISNYDTNKGFDLFMEIQNTAFNFGIVPNKVFNEMHPVRSVNKHASILFSTIRLTDQKKSGNDEGDVSLRRSATQPVYQTESVQRSDFFYEDRTLKHFELPYENLNRLQKKCKPIFVESDENYVYVFESDSKFMIAQTQSCFNAKKSMRESRGSFKFNQSGISDLIVYTDLSAFVQIDDDRKSNVISPLVKLSISATPSKLFCIVGNNLISCSSWYPMIHIVKIDQKSLNDNFAITTPTSIFKEISLYQSVPDVTSPFKMHDTLQLPSPVTIVQSCGKNSFLTVTIDSFIICWGIKMATNEYSNNEKIVMKYKIIPHLAKIAAIGCSSQLNLLVSGSKDRRIVLSKLDDGTYLRSFISKTPIDSILVDSMPCIIVASNIQAELNDVNQSTSTRITTYSINDSKDSNNNEIPISEIVIDKKEITAWCSIHNTFHCDNFVACCFDDFSMIILSVPMLTIISEKKLGFRVNHVNFNSQNSSLIFTCSDGLVHYVKL